MKIERISKDEGYIEITEEEYLEDLASGLSEEEVFKPGRHKYIRGGFFKRHPNFDPANVKITVEVTLSLDRKVLRYFEQLAKETNADSYEIPMKQVLLEAVERGKRKEAAPSLSQQEALLDNPQFIKAVAERVKKTMSKKAVSKKSSQTDKRRRRAA
ncbi:MAG: hypothetical protein ACREBD_18305 [Blastocatellia bacterium]